MARLFRRSFVMLAALTLVLAACGGSDAELEGQTWTLTGVGNRPAVSTAISTLTFTNGTLNGNSGCNEFSTSYSVDGTSMTIDPQIAATLRACEPAMNDQEAAVFTALTATAAFDISGTTLRLLDDSEAALARYSSESE